jgi:hypothetical protein
MPDLSFAVEEIRPAAHAVIPTLMVRLRLANSTPNDRIQHVALQTQVQIEPVLRNYVPEEQTRLRDLFGDPSRWSDTLKTMLWAHVNVIVPGFDDSMHFDLPLPCTFDFNVAATKYFAGLEGGEVPLRFLFTGTIFYRSPEGELQIAQIPWDREARFRLSVDTWHRMMALYYPDTAWLCLPRNVFARLYEYKVRRGLPTLEGAMSEILDQVEA